MRWPEQADDLGFAIDDQREMVEDVAAEDAHVERFGLRECGVLTLEHGQRAVRSREAEFGIHRDRRYRSADPAQLSDRLPGIELKLTQKSRVENGSVGTRIHEQIRSQSRTIGFGDIDRDDGKDAAVFSPGPRAGN